MSPVPPGMPQCAGCLHPCRAQQDAVWGCSLHPVQPPPAGKCRRREVQHLALGVGKGPGWEGGCSELGGVIKLPFIRLSCKNELAALQQVPHFIYCSCAAGHDIGPWSSLSFIPISDPGRTHLPHRPHKGVRHTACTCPQLHSSDPGKWLFNLQG